MIINTIFFYSNIFSQSPSNESVYNNLVIKYLKENPVPVSSAEGIITDTIRPFVHLDSISDKILVLSEPEITIKKTSKEKASRRISVSAETRDSSSGILRELVYEDTISFRDWKRVQKTEHVLLRSDDPRFLNKAIFPVFCILAGVAGIILLFYLRS